MDVLRLPLSGKEVKMYGEVKNNFAHIARESQGRNPTGKVLVRINFEMIQLWPGTGRYIWEIRALYSVKRDFSFWLL